jgi:hypothetical protein
MNLQIGQPSNPSFSDACRPLHTRHRQLEKSALARASIPPMHRRNIRLPVPAFLAILLSAPFNLAQDESPDACEHTAQMQVYSDARYVEEAGDVVGDELAVKRHEGNLIDGQLYFYQGEPNKDGISLSGHIVGKKLTMEGEWVPHIVEDPSNEQIVETHHVTVNGTLEVIS